MPTKSSVNAMASSAPTKNAKVAADQTRITTDLPPITPDEAVILGSIDAMLAERRKLTDIIFRNGQIVLKHWMTFETANAGQFQPSEPLRGAIKWFTEYEKKRDQAATREAEARFRVKQRTSGVDLSAAGSHEETIKMASRELSEQLGFCQKGMADHTDLVDRESVRATVHTKGFYEERDARADEEDELQADIKELKAITLMMYRCMNGREWREGQ